MPTPAPDLVSDLASITFASPGQKLDRAYARRPEMAQLATLPETRTVALSEGRIAVALDADKRLCRWHRSRLAGLDPIETVFLGLEGESPLLATDLGPLTEDQAEALLGEHVKFIDLRSISPELSALDAEITATARALLGWHARHRFCSVCGAPSGIEDGGWRRRCPACGATHFPRVDPVVIMLVTREDHVLLGRQKGWPPGLHSLLAGYIEPGETPEDAVRREVMEEAGVPIGRVDYLASQPWPFPSTLMIGYRAEALDWPLLVDPVELEGAEWVSRAEMARVLAGDHERLASPRRDAIARSMIAAWVTGEVTGF
ncbi:MAG: NAD(+) diphosphatase [Pseudomonadota bacterium]